MTVKVSLPTNTQSISKPDQNPDGNLRVIDVWPTIQGEGPFVGMPAAFVRLAGCNLQCPQCDTDYTVGPRGKSIQYDVTTLLGVIRGNARDVKTKLIVFTGGEPFRQNIEPLCQRLCQEDYFVQIESNGTLSLSQMPWYSGNLFLVCSPKAPMINGHLRGHIKALKYVLSADAVDPNDGLPTSVLGNNLSPARPWAGFPREQVYVSPADVGCPLINKANRDAAVKSCLTYGYRLSIQIHKLCGLL
jgi:7-carboxy-7-deazaguanine synthase